MKYTLIGLLVLASSLLYSADTHAVDVNTDYFNVETACESTGSATYTAMYFAPADEYDVYIKLGARGQRATTEVFAQAYTDAETPTCEALAKRPATGDMWQRVGLWSVSGEAPTIFQVSSDELSNDLDANRPTLMLVSRSAQTCVPQRECYVEVDGQQGYVRAPGTLTTQDALKVVRVVDPSQDAVKSVVSYVDGRPAYKTAALEAFDLRYVTYSNQKLAQVVSYESGQSVVIESTPPEGFNDSLVNYIFRIYHYNTALSNIIIGVLSVAILGGIILGAYGHLHKRRIWRMQHGLINNGSSQVYTLTQMEHDLKVERVEKRVKVIGSIGSVLVLIIGAIVFINSYVSIIYRVHGESMTHTFADGKRVLVNRIPVSLAGINGSGYVPARGEAVILRAVYGVADEMVVANSEEEYIIKRVVGLPGERVVVDSGRITVYNKEHPEGMNPDKDASWADTMRWGDDTEKADVTLGDDEIFVAGDNRPGSVDSRFNGPIGTRQLVGLVGWQLW